jgi:hypothetical protein
MAAMVLNSPKAVQMSIFVVRAFTAMREQIAIRDALARRLNQVERRLLRHDAALQDLYTRLRQLSTTPGDTTRKRIGFRSGA